MVRGPRNNRVLDFGGDPYHNLGDPDHDPDPGLHLELDPGLLDPNRRIF